MRNLETTTTFKKDLRRTQKRGRDLTKLASIIEQLRRDEPLPERYRDHRLIGGEYHGNNECHIEPDWLLVYRKSSDGLILTATRTGSHSDLF